MAKYSDICLIPFILDGMPEEPQNDLIVLPDNQAQILTDRAVIAQDLIHMIRESGLLIEMVGERSADRRRLLAVKIILLVETDTRIIPGTVIFNVDTVTGRTVKWTLTADTYEFGILKYTLTTGAEE